jgi:hypothetical protein
VQKPLAPLALEPQRQQEQARLEQALQEQWVLERQALVLLARGQLRELEPQGLALPLQLKALVPLEQALQKPLAQVPQQARLKLQELEQQELALLRWSKELEPMLAHPHLCLEVELE